MVQLTFEIVPLTLKDAKEFVKQHHRHNKEPTGHKFSIGLMCDKSLVGVVVAGRPVARGLDDGFTIEISRTCTLGHPNSNSILYAAAWNTAKNMGYQRGITYTQQNESGASLRASGWTPVKILPARGSWAESSVMLRHTRDPIGNGGVERIRWEIQNLKPSKRIVEVNVCYVPGCAQLATTQIRIGKIFIPSLCSEHDPLA